ncbi:MAG: hypothetical protein ACTSQF_03530 [Candidatus Heimdallarchaeaceae archaeon]
MPDILDSEKSKIREIAAHFAQNLWRISFTEGLKAYIQSSEEIYVHPARWKYCFKCGEINKKESMTAHECSLEFKEFPILVQTSWYKLKQFFLTDRYKSIVKELGISDLPLFSPISEPRKVKLDSKPSEPIVEEEKI